jgi:diguanylate cyclase (GGDEF)-like protein
MKFPRLIDNGLRPKPLYAICFIAIIVFPAVIFSAFIKDQNTRIILSDVYAPIINTASTVALFAAAYYSRRISRRIAWGWLFIAFAQLMYTYGDICWAYLEIHLHAVDNPTIADVFYLLYYPFLLAGAFIFANKKLRSYELIKRILDINVVMVVAVILYWIFIFFPITNQSQEISDLQIFITIAYPIGDLFLLFSVLLLIYARLVQIHSRSIWLLVASIMVMGFSDSFYILQSVQTGYTTGGVIDLGWILSYSIILLAGVYQVSVALNKKEEDTLPEEEVEKIEKISRRLTYLPILWAIGAVVVVIYALFELPQIDANWIFVGLGIMFALIIIRQLITIQENEGLLVTLQHMLVEAQEQTEKLTETNTRLSHEMLERDKVEQKFHHLILHDGLTGLANRELFLDRLSHSIRIAQREQNNWYSILFIGVNNLKSFNERLGHSAGDLILTEFARRLISCTRSVDTVARFSGNEFVILIENGTFLSTDQIVAKRILNKIEEPFVVNGKNLHVSCNIGIVEGNPKYNNPEDVIQDALITFDRAREIGKGKKEVFNPSMRTALLYKYKIEEDLKQAVSNSELFLNYQPIYSLNENRIVSVEALVRWQHPQHGCLMPNNFIEIAEKSGMIIPLGYWVLQVACNQLKSWINRFPDLDQFSISVNITGKQLFQKDFIQRIKTLLASTGISPSNLELEITENTYIENQTIVSNLLKDLQKIGVKFSIDDFGTGFSSIGYLKKFSVETLKIDKSFIDDLLRSEKDMQIARTIILIADSLGMQAIAEGIEKEDQFNTLKSLGCKYGQGHYMSPALSAEGIEKLLAEQASPSNIVTSKYVN